MAFRLAELFVEFGAKGAGALKGAIGEVAGGFTAAKVALAGFVAAGLAGTSQGDALAGSMKHFSETVASLFLPVINTASMLIRDFSEKLMASAGAEKFQNAMARIADIMVRVFDRMMPVGIRLFDAFATALEIVITPFEWLATIFDKIMDSGFNDWMDEILAIALALVNPILLFAIAIEKISDFVKAGGDPARFAQLQAERDRQSREGGGGRGIDRVTSNKGGMEDLLATYKRLQQASLQAEGQAVNYPKRQTELLDQISKNTANTSDEVRRKPSTIGA